MRLLFPALLSVLLSCTSLWAADHAVVLLYHHVSDATPASTSVSPEIFQQHLDYLEREGFNVLQLGTVLKILAEGGTVPEKTVSITFDDAYRSVSEHAAPMLQEKNWPFTVFVSTEAIDRGYRNYLTWGDLRGLLAGGAEFGNHSHSHAHLVRRMDGETDAQWRSRVSGDMELAGQRLKKELGVEVSMFAYPFGEHGPELGEIVGALGYIGIAQQSGAIGHGFDRLAVPRFPMATDYADMDRFVLSVNARPLPVKNVTAAPVVLVQGQNRRSPFSFTLPQGYYRSSALVCYSSSGEQLEMRREGVDGASLFSVQLPDWRAGRRKINCTAPSSVEKGVYYWYSHLWMVKHPDGTWYTE